MGGACHPFPHPHHALDHVRDHGLDLDHDHDHRVCLFPFHGLASRQACSSQRTSPALVHLIACCTAHRQHSDDEALRLPPPPSSYACRVWTEVLSTSACW